MNQNLSVFPSTYMNAIIERMKMIHDLLLDGVTFDIISFHIAISNLKHGPLGPLWVNTLEMGHY